jgi:predicted RNA-binding Zn-ribbon protein involved in translation (DUF1610 family)
MVAHAGESAHEGGTFHCAKCNIGVRVNKGDNIPKCPNCGNDTYDHRTDETSG